MGDTGTTMERRFYEKLKISCLSRGIRISDRARRWLSEGGTEPLTIREYPTTGGVTLELMDSVYINAPFDEWYTDDPVAELDGEDADFGVRFMGEMAPVVRVLPLPGYLAATDASGRKVTDVAMSHTDRIRLSPLVGCAYDCKFCDLPNEQYTLRGSEQVLAAYDVALEDQALPPRHTLISGGSPRRTHYEEFERTCTDVIESSPIPVDIMMSPMIDGVGFVERVVEAGVNGFAINLELYSEASSIDVLGRKYRTTRPVFDDFISAAVELTGPGRVRSLIIPGLEPLDETIAGVEFLASRGVDPVLSPFRPAEDTPLCRTPPMSEDDIETVLHEARAIVEHYDVELGPRCLPCQHNTLTFPWDVEAAS